MYRNSWSGSEFPVSLIPMFFAGLGAIISFIAMMPPSSGMGPVYLMSASLTVMLFNTFLYKTNVSRSLNQHQRRAWDEYKGLPVEYKNEIALTVRMLSDMSNVEAQRLADSFREMRKNHKALREERMRYSGPTHELNKRVERLIQDSKIELDTTREVNKEMESLL
jgi:hypothetical protein